MGGWYSNDAIANDKKFACLNLGVAPTIFRARASSTTLIPFFYTDYGQTKTNEYNFWTSYVPGTVPTRDRNSRMYFRPNTSQISVIYNREATGGAIGITASPAEAAVHNTHYMAVWVYDETAWTHRILVYKEGEAEAIADWTSAPGESINHIEDVGASDEFYLGSGATNQTTVHNIFGGPVLGIVCRKDVLNTAAIEAIWNGGATPNLRSLFPATTADMAFCVGMHGNLETVASNAMVPKVPNVKGAVANNSIQYWDESDGVTSGNFVAVITPGDQRADNDGSFWDNGQIDQANFLALTDVTYAEGGFWQPGVGSQVNPITPIGGHLPKLAAAIAGKRTGTKPLMFTSHGNSRTANSKSGTVVDGGVFEGVQSLAYGVLRSNPSLFAGLGMAHLGYNLNAYALFYDRYESGSPPGPSGAVPDNKNRYGFGSSSTDDPPSYPNAGFGPGQVYRLSAADIMEIRFDTRDMTDGSTHDSQQWIVYAKRPGAGSIVAASTAALIRDNTAAGIPGTPTGTISLDTATTTGMSVFSTSNDGDTTITLSGDQTALIAEGDLLSFDGDTDIAVVVSANLVAGQTLIALAYPLIGAKTGMDASVGPLEYLYVGEGQIDAIDENGVIPWRGVTTTASVGPVEIIAAGFYYTDKPNGLCVTVMGWGANGEGYQVDAEASNAMNKYLVDVGIDGAIVNYGTQGEAAGTFEGHLEDRLGSRVDQIEILGASDGLFNPTASYLTDDDSDAVDLSFRDFATNHRKAVAISVFVGGHDWVSSSYMGYMLNGSHQTAAGSLFRGGLLWTQINSDLSLLGGSSPARGRWPRRRSRR